MDNETRLVICVGNAGYEASLELRKVYQVVLDETGESRGYLRVVDESGEDYLYLQELFIPVELPTLVQEAVLAAR